MVGAGTGSARASQAACTGLACHAAPGVFVVHFVQGFAAAAEQELAPFLVAKATEKA